MRLFVAIIAGLILGIIGSRYLFVGSFLSLLPWSLVGLATGIYAKTKKEALINGAIYGFVLSLIFMLSGYKGSRPVFMVLPFFILLGLFGAICGSILGLIGLLIKKVYKRK